MVKPKYEKPTIQRYAPLFIGSPGKPSFQDKDHSLDIQRRDFDRGLQGTESEAQNPEDSK